MLNPEFSREELEAELGSGSAPEPARTAAAEQQGALSSSPVLLSMHESHRPAQRIPHKQPACLMTTHGAGDAAPLARL